MNSSDRVRIAVDLLGGIATRRQLVEKGFSGWQLTAAVRQGSVRRVRRGWYASTTASPAAALAVRVGGRLSHTSAARDFGLWAGHDPRVHLTVTRGGSRLRRVSFGGIPPAVVHWTRTGRQPLTAPVTWRVELDECLRGVLRTSDEETAIACLDTAVTLFGLTVSDIQSMFAGEPKESLLRAARSRPGSDSGLESICRQRFERMGLRIEQQVKLRGVGYVDFVLNGVLVVEINGHEFHSTKKDLDRDHRRDSELTRRAVAHLRFTYDQVVDDWPYVERTVRACLS